jgi:hypothetical protein
MEIGELVLLKKQAEKKGGVSMGGFGPAGSRLVILGLEQMQARQYSKI